MNPDIWALVVAVIYLVPFIALGWIVKRVIDRYMRGHSLGDVHELAGQDRPKRKVFLLGAWRDES
jgi:phosphoribulokinase